MDKPIERRKSQGLQKPAPLRDLDAARREWVGLEREMCEQLPKIGPNAVQRRIDYQYLRGDNQWDIVWQMLHHMVNHGTYHRGQITTMLRQMGTVPPPSMDLIVFYRERNMKPSGSQ